MKRFKNILLVSGGEGWKETALKRAVALAKVNRARLTIVDVLEELPREMRVLVTSMHLADLQQVAVAKRFKVLKRLIEPILKKRIQVSAKVLVGTPLLEIIQEVIKNKNDLVIKTATGMVGFRERLFGNTAIRLMRKCPCPVWVINPSHQKKYARILAAVDPDPLDRKRNTLNEKIMELATSLACIEGSELHVVHAWRLFGETLLLGPGRMSQVEVDKLARKTMMEHKRRVTELVEKHAPGLPAGRIHLLKGDADALIPALAKRMRIELLVMGTVTRTGIAGFIMGSTAEGVLPQVDCSVLTTKPDGFVSPVSCRQGRKRKRGA